MANDLEAEDLDEVPILERRPTLRVRYQLDATRTHAHAIDVVMRIERDAPGPLELFLPAWIPGTYAIRDFARDITRVSARAGPRALTIRKSDKSDWRIDEAPAALELSYRVYARDLTPHGLYLDEERGFISPARALLAIKGALDVPLSLTLDVPLDFDLATTLTREGEPSSGSTGIRHAFWAEDYYALIDHPLQIGALERFDFDVNGARHEWVMSGGWRCDTLRLAGDLQLICEETCRLFASEPVADPYLFLTSLVGDGYGGLEHQASTHLITSRYNLPVTGDDRVTDGYRTLLGLCSHEYMHAWWVKRVRPAALDRPDLSREVPTRLLWLFEGFTAYYDDLLLVRSHVIDEASYLELVARQITRVLQAPGRRVRSLEQASFDAWMLLFRAPEHAPNSTVSYYAKGATLALGLDLHIRLQTENKKSLDEVMRAFWARREVPLEESEFLALASEASTVDLTEWHARYVEGTEDPPVDELLAEFAIGWTLRRRRSTIDRGGNWARDTDLARVELGLTFHGAAPTRVLTVLEDGPAWRAGVASGDILLALDGARVHGTRLFRLLSRYRPGDEAELHVFRDDRLKVLRVRFDEPEPDVVVLRMTDRVDADKIIRREHWLLGTVPGGPL